jgi:NAD-dependent dihydropyrimidine dehydrogenase PreA subunit
VSTMSHTSEVAPAARWCYALVGTCYTAGLFAVAIALPRTAGALGPVLLVVGAVLGSLPSRSSALFCEYSTLFLTWWLLGWPGPGNAIFAYLPLACAVMIGLSHGSADRSAGALGWGVAIVLLALVHLLAPTAAFAPHYAYLIATALMLAIYTASVAPRPVVVRKIDLILCSSSGNTADCAAHFADGAAAAGAAVIVHRFHRYREFQAQLDGDSLVVAFPVIGWKPPWPLLNYLVWRLPRGDGKPAFVLYTSAGGPENTGVLTWALLLLKGYRVLGRGAGVYPINLATVRLGPSRMWRYLDSLLPRAEAVVGLRAAGRDFARGRRAGLPLIWWPSPLFALGPLVDNAWFDRIYRNHVFRRRCTGCGVCVDVCPAQRLRLVAGYPRARGTCALCFGCVNHCPVGAMHLWLLTEYGNRYQPRSHAGPGA